MNWSKNSFSLSLALALALVAVGCGDDEPGANGSPNGTTLDMGVDDSGLADADLDDGVDDAGADMDVGDDAGMVSCTAPSVMVAGTAATDVLAESPARCGAADYQWLRSNELGDVVEYGQPSGFNAGLINFAASSEGIELPRQAEYDVGIEQFVYTTQDRGELVEATSLVAFPRGLEANEPVGVVLVLHGTTGFTDACSPSPTQEQQALAAILATYGYIAVAPDYIGLKGLGEPTGFKHPYLVGEATAIASLDALRALHKIPRDRIGGLCPSTDFAYFGGSQGGHAALWVDRLAPYYAREFTPLGGVATVPPADLLGEMERALQEIVQATGNTVAFLGASADWYGYEDELNTVFVEPYDTDVPRVLSETCSPDDEIDVEPTQLSDLFTAEILAAASSGELADYEFVGCMATENALTTTSIERIPSELDSYGILNVFGENDRLVHTPIERVAHEDLCDAGIPLQYLECAGAGHTDATFWAFGEIFEFLEARLAKEVFQAPGSCAPNAPERCSGTP